MKRYVETLDITAALELEDELTRRDEEMAAFKAAQEQARPQTEPEPQPWPQSQPEPREPQPAQARREPVYRWSLQMEFCGSRGFAQVVVLEQCHPDW